MIAVQTKSLIKSYKTPHGYETKALNRLDMTVESGAFIGIMISIPTDIMAVIMKKFAQCFEIKRIKECDDCAKNCENCVYKLAVNN